MLRIFVGFIVLSSAYPTTAFAAGFARSDNFVVMAPDQDTAEIVRRQAEFFRESIAVEWLGQELPDGIGRAVITVVISTNEDTGITWAMDDPERKFHDVWLTTSIDRAVGTTLAHEIAHVVLAEYARPNRIPAWFNEGVASTQDDNERQLVRQNTLSKYSQDGPWPSLQKLFEMSRIPHGDVASYTVSSSVVQYLAQRGGKKKAVRFALDGKIQGWERALRDHYGIRNIDELQLAWKRWAMRHSAHADLSMENGRILAPERMAATNAGRKIRRFPLRKRPLTKLR